MPASNVIPSVIDAHDRRQKRTPEPPLSHIVEPVDVYLLWHVRHAPFLDGRPTRHCDESGELDWGEQDGDDLKILGAYSTEQKAQDRIVRAQALPGFRDEPDCFFVDSYTLDEDPDGVDSARKHIRLRACLARLDHVSMHDAATVTLWRPTAPRNWRSSRRKVAGLAAATDRPTDLLSRAQRGVRHHDRPGLERACLWRGIRHPLSGPPVLPRPLRRPPGRRCHHPGVLDPGRGPRSAQCQHRRHDRRHRRVSLSSLPAAAR
jgi:hypothetical protein